jgi:hypothetical protein
VKEKLLGGRVLYKIKEGRDVDCYIGVGMGRYNWEEDYKHRVYLYGEYYEYVREEEKEGTRWEFVIVGEYLAGDFGFNVEVGYARLAYDYRYHKYETYYDTSSSWEREGIENVIFAGIGLHYYFRLGED